MAKTKISEFDVDPANNTDINSINIAEGCAPSGINNAIRQLMSDLKEFQTGAGGDPFNGAVNGTLGATTPNTAVVTTLTANTSVSTDTISEKTSAAGVTIDSVLLKDNTVTANSVNSQNTFGFKNRIINGAMVIDQRNAGASVTPTNGAYTLDRWAAYAAGSAIGKFTVQQSSTVPEGFSNSLKVTSTSAYSISSGDITAIFQVIEGYNVSDLSWGTANAKTITLSFKVYSSLTGTFGGCLKNNAGNRSYPFSYSIPVANTWTQISLTIAGDTTGTWLTTNSGGIFVQFGLGVGSTYSATAGSWTAGDFYSATGATSVVGTNGATFYITGVQLEKGSTATSFDYRPYGTELALCQRYFYKASNSRFGQGGWNSTTSADIQVKMPTTMRATPTLSAPNLGQLLNLSVSWHNITSSSLTSESTPDIITMLCQVASSGSAQGKVAVIGNGGGGSIDYLFSAEL